MSLAAHDEAARRRGSTWPRPSEAQARYFDEEGVEAAGVDVAALSVEADGFALLEASDDPSDFDPLFGVEEYRSAYQPPPFKMKLPPLICRFAVDLPHFGQTWMGSSEIFWISSH